MSTTTVNQVSSPYAIYENETKIASIPYEVLRVASQFVSKDYGKYLLMGIHLKVENDEITIASTGNATDFGDLSAAKNGLCGAASSTRLIFAGGKTPSMINVMEYVTIASAGNVTDFGDLTHTNAYFNTGNSNGTRGIFMGGSDIDSPYPATDQIDYVTIASAGNAIDFGSLNTSRYNAMGASNSTRGVIAGGRIQPAPSLPATNLMEFVNIASTGNAFSFGELIEPENSGAGCSDSHGGLS